MVESADRKFRKMDYACTCVSINEKLSYRMSLKKIPNRNFYLAIYLNFLLI